MRQRRVGAIGMVAVVAGLTACATAPRDPGVATTTNALGLSFEDVLAPAAFRLEGRARADPDGAPGLWAVVPGLPRPERGRVENLASGATVTVALFASDGGDAVRLSRAAAEALGIGGAPAAVRVTAVRREPRIAPP